SVVRSVSGSAKLYSLRQIESLTDPPDWFPEDHAPMPQIVARGRAEGVFACASCHLTSGRGTPASADLAGLPIDYLVRQLKDFRSGERRDPVRMNGIAKAMDDKEIRDTAEWFSRLQVKPWTRLVETDTVPRSYVTKARMRL